MKKIKPINIELSLHSIQSENDLDKEYNIKDLTGKCPKCNSTITGGTKKCINCDTEFDWSHISVCRNGNLVMVNDGEGGIKPNITTDNILGSNHKAGRCPKCGCFVYDVSDVCFNCNAILLWTEEI